MVVVAHGAVLLFLTEDWETFPDLRRFFFLFFFFSFFLWPRDVELMDLSANFER